MRKYLITVFAASSCSGVKVFDGCGPEGGGVGGGEGDVVVWEGCCGAVLQDSESLLSGPGDSLPSHEDSSKAAVVVAVVMVLPMRCFIVQHLHWCHGPGRCFQPGIL